MRSTLFLIFICFCASLLGQTQTHSIQYGLSVSNLTTFGHSDRLVLDPAGAVVGIRPMRAIDLLQIAPAFLWQDKAGNFMEASITQFRAHRQTLEGDRGNGSTVKGNDLDLGIGLQYSYFMRFNKKSASHWSPMLGLDIMPYANSVSHRPTQTYDFPYRRTVAGLSGWLDARLMWMPNERWFFNLGASAAVFDLTFHFDRDDNPSNLPFQGNGNYLSWMMFTNDYRLQLGAGIKL